MKKLLSVFLVSVMLLSVVPLSVIGASAETVTSGITGDCTWTLDGTKLTISGNGYMDNHAVVNNRKPWPETITEIVIEEGVISIGQDSFYNCKSIESITIPKTICLIGSGAFGNSKIENVYIEDLASWCAIKFGNWDWAHQGSNPLSVSENLYVNGELTSNLVIPNTVTEISPFAFAYFENFNTLTISDGVETIGDRCFQNCNGLTDVYISKTLKTVGINAFKGCTGLKNVHIKDMTAWCSIDFGYEPYWYDGDMEYLEGGFCNSNPLITAENLVLNGKVITELVIPEGMKTLGDGTFCGYRKLKKVTFPKGFKSVSDAAFKDTGITEIIMSNDITHIGELAFAGCNLLVNIQLSGSIETIGMMAFRDCSSLENVWFGGSTADKSKIKYLDVGPYDYSIYPGYKYLHKAVWYYNTCFEHELDEDGVCTVCGSTGFNETLKKVGNQWQLYVNGKRSYDTTLVKFNTKWFYIKNGVWNKNADTMVKYNGKWFYVENGKWNSTVKGLRYYKGKYFYIKNGKWDRIKTGFITHNGNKVYVKNGKWQQKTQILKYNGKNYLFKNGVKSEYTGLLRLNEKWYYFKKGVWYKEKDIVRYVPKKVKIKKGVYIRSYYLEGYKGELFYVNNGYARLDYTGTVKVNGKTYKIKNGIVV